MHYACAFKITGLSYLIRLSFKVDKVGRHCFWLVTVEIHIVFHAGMVRVSTQKRVRSRHRQLVLLRLHSNIMHLLSIAIQIKNFTYSLG